MLRAFTDAKTDKQYFFEGKNTNQTLGLYRNANNKLCLDLNGTIVESSLTVSTGSWHTIGISYDTVDPNDSQVVFKYKNIRFFVDGIIDTKQVQALFNYDSLSFMIGRSHNEIMINNIYNSYPLYGQIEMLVVSNYYVSEATLRNLANEMLGITKTNEYDQFDRFKYKSIENGNVIVSNEYSFKNSTNTSNVVSSEKIILNNTALTRKYETNAINNVTSITDSVFGSHNYTYDYRGFLTKEDDIEYKYDNNGNITKAGNDTFTYDNLNRLRSVNGWPISYSNVNPGNPRKNNDIEYEFEGRRLKSVSEPMGIGEQKTVDYTYDSNGLIIKKVLGYWYDDDRDSEEFTTQYYYDGDKLVTEINQYCRLDFLYDENGMLYGLIKDNSSKYFYVRDYLQNILGIVDQSGKLVVKYKYDAYGNSKGIEDTSGCSLGSRNPFRYKGYYYDDDTEMYYCKSRFYVPKWRRWLNSDSIDYLEPQNITCLNLFAYCNNNPVMYVDENGHEGIAVLILLGLAFLATYAATLSVKNDYSDSISGITNLIEEKVREALNTIRTNIEIFAIGLKYKRIYDSNERHHIVAKGALRAYPARKILEMSNININDERNLVDVKKGYHRVMHTNAYYLLLNTSMIIAYSVNGSKGVEDVLKIYKRILGGLTY